MKCSVYCMDKSFLLFYAGNSLMMGDGDFQYVSTNIPLHVHHMSVSVECLTLNCCLCY